MGTASSHQRSPGTFLSRFRVLGFFTLLIYLRAIACSLHCRFSFKYSVLFWFCYFRNFIFLKLIMMDFSSYKRKIMRRLANSWNLSLKILLLLMLRFWFLHNTQFFFEILKFFLLHLWCYYQFFRWRAVQVTVICCNSGFNLHCTIYILCQVIRGRRCCISSTVSSFNL